MLLGSEECREDAFGSGCEEGKARLRIALDGGGRSVPAGVFQKAPLRILFPPPGPGEPLCAVLLNTGGGIVGGDALTVRVRLEPGTAAVTTSQAVEKVYRSAGAIASWACSSSSALMHPGHSRC